MGGGTAGKTDPGSKLKDEEEGRAEMDALEELRSICTEYEEAVREIEKNKRMFDGILGLGNHPGNDPCHEKLDRRITALCALAAEEGDAAEREALAEAVFRLAESWKGPEYGRLMLLAQHRHTLALIPGLSREGRERLADWYGKTYPRRKRLPVQDQVFAALKG